MEIEVKLNDLKDLSVPANKFDLFLALPKDVIGLFMLKYFYPADALTCLRVCKLLKSMISAEESLQQLRIRVVKQIAYEKQMESFGDKRPCRICNHFISLKTMKRHLAKHEARGICSSIRSLVIDKCDLCEAPYPQRSPHSRTSCPMKRIKCVDYYEHQHYFTYQWATLICEKKEGFRIEMRKHSCFYRCKICSKEFKSENWQGNEEFFAHPNSHTVEEWILFERNSKTIIP
jgi:hypothetical protein